MPHVPGNDLNLGILPGRSASLTFPRTARDKHLYVCGGTGTGKSKFLESLIRQDILAWRKSRCGLSPRDFEAQIGSTVNRLQRFIRNQTMRATFGLGGASLDLRRSLDEGHIIIVSLATERAKVSKENAELFATLLLSDLWTAAQERGKREGVNPSSAVRR